MSTPEVRATLLELLGPPGAGAVFDTLLALTGETAERAAPQDVARLWGFCAFFEESSPHAARLVGRLRRYDEMLSEHSELPTMEEREAEHYARRLAYERGLADAETHHNPGRSFGETLMLWAARHGGAH